tara:strand:+ start:170 stop:382 length:213 start_codon:yes stop_codon:yes gene_type:complete
MSNNTGGLNLNNVLNDLSLNVYTLKNEYNVSDISNQINNLGNNIDILNNQLEQILELYTIVDNLKERANA